MLNSLNIYIMPKNVEIKAYASEFDSQKAIAASLSDTPLEILEQKDTFFSVAEGRLKLRIFNDDFGQLILYKRSNQSGPKISEYQISETSSPNSLKQIMTNAYGVVGQVNKTRYLYISGRTRIHFDQVHGLGDFIELEVILNPSESQLDGKREAENLMDKLKITPQNLIDLAYTDLLAKQKTTHSVS